MKQKKGGKNKKKEWNQVPIGEEFLTESEMQNIISLEVMTDYEIIKRPDGLTEIQSSAETEKLKGKLGKGIKRKAEDDDDESDEQPEEVEEEPMEPESMEAEISMEEWIKAGVRDPILKALKDAGFEKPTAIQELTLPASLLGKKDVVGAAETGSGKTLAFAIPMIHGILEGRKRKIKSNKEELDDIIEQSPLQALILTPTRELAVQIKKHFDVVAKYADIKTVVIMGGLAAQKQERLLRWKPDVVIATPGRLWELTKEGNPHLETLNRIKYLAVDETDRMVEQGHFKELEGILEVINKDPTVKERRQNFVFSATLAFTHEPPERLNKGNKKFKQHQPKKITSKDKLKQIMEMIGVRSNPKIVDITSKKGTCETLTEMQINCPANKKDFYMYYFLIKHPGRTIVFCNSINCVRRLTNLFFLLKCSQVLPLHSEMHQKSRLKNLEKFAEDDKSVLIATDVAARGLDIVDIQHVIHYEIPKTAESYIHRSGRTARAFKGGLALVFVEPSEIGRLKSIFRSLSRDADVMLPLFNVDGAVFKQLKARVDEADKVEKFEHTVRKKLADMNWMDKAKKEMDLASSDDDDNDNDDAEGRSRKNLLLAKKKLENYKQTLNKLLSDNSFLLRNNVKV